MGFGPLGLFLATVTPRLTVLGLRHHVHRIITQLDMGAPSTIVTSERMSSPHEVVWGLHKIPGMSHRDLASEDLMSSSVLGISHLDTGNNLILSILLRTPQRPCWPRDVFSPCHRLLSSWEQTPPGSLISPSYPLVSTRRLHLSVIDPKSICNPGTLPAPLSESGE